MRLNSTLFKPFTFIFYIDVYFYRKLTNKIVKGGEINNEENFIQIISCFLYFIS